MEKEKFIDGAAEYSRSALGAVAGALLGTVIENTFKWAGEEIKTCCLSKTENKKTECRI